jgi:arylsulfatase A-like enzyme
VRGAPGGGSGAVARAVGVFVVASSAWLAYRAGGGGDPRPSPPTAARAEPLALGTGKGADGYQVDQRLTDKMGEARVESQGAQNRAPLLAHWRKMPIAWAPLSGDALKSTTTIALRTSDKETQWSMPGQKGQWEPDARIWNMNEGSFDQRDAIAAPTPATVTFHLRIPAQARLDFATALLGGRGETEFGVSVTDGQGRAKELFARAMPSKEAKEWLDATVDLGAYSGQTVDLSLRATPKLMVAMTNGMSQIEASSSAVALWGNPVLLTKGPTLLPYNVLFVVVDALRPDVIASFHDDEEDAAKEHAKRPPLEALLPKVPGLLPAIDELASRGVRFTHAYSSGAWTRPGTLAMLAGARSTELGVDPLPWVLPPEQASRFYASSPPLLTLLLRRAGMQTRAFVNNYFMVGYASVGVDMGFERVDDHRYRTRDTMEITQHATSWMKEHVKDRFFLFCNFNSPHEPWEPPERYKTRVPAPPAGPVDLVTRMYMAEAAKDDEAVGVLLAALDELGLRERTLVVLTADHGETLSSAHDGRGLDKMQIRYHHAVSNYEETTRIPILLSLPGVLPEGREVKARVRSIDIAPTVLELLGVERSPKSSGASLMPLVRGETEPDERVVLSEGRGTRALLSGKYRLLVREGAAQITTSLKGDKTETVAEELYDLEDDPGERHNLAKDRPELVVEMRARMEAARKNVAVAGTQAAARPDPPDASTFVHLRFAGGGGQHRISGAVHTVDPKAKIGEAAAFGAAPEAVRLGGGRVDLALVTAADALVGVDLRVEPPSAALAWELFLDDAPLAASQVFAGPFGFAAPSLRLGVASDEARAAAYSPVVPQIDPQRDLGLFVTRERPGDPPKDDGPARGVTREDTPQGAEEMGRLLREWGYAHSPPAPASAVPSAAPPPKVPKKK